MELLKVTIIQSELYWEDKLKNLKMFEEKIISLNESPDIIVLPEMFSTGFSMNSEGLAESMDSDTVNWMIKTSKKTNAAICGSIIIRENEKHYNRFIWVDPNGNIQFYNKRHLFSMGEEHKHYTSGSENILIQYKGWRIRPIVCYDLRFPVWCRNTDDYDALIVVANWPDKRISHWDTLIKARAIENQSYVIAANRIGQDPNDLSYTGHSSIVDPFGDTIYFSNNSDVSVQTISLDKLKLIRRQFPFLKDRDLF